MDKCIQWPSDTADCIRSEYWVEMSYSADGAIRHFKSEAFKDHLPPAAVESTRSRALATRQEDVESVRGDFLKRVGIGLQNSINRVVEITAL